LHVEIMDSGYGVNYSDQGFFFWRFSENG
jgi:hypothetical protein